LGHAFAIVGLTLSQSQEKQKGDLMKPSPITLKHWIGGHWIPGQSTGRRLNPANLRETVAEFPIGTAQDLEQAVEAANRAFAKLKKIPAPLRGEWIQNLGELVRKNKQTLSEVVTREIGKPIGESQGSVQEVIDTCRFFASEGRRLYGQTVPSEMNHKKLMTYRKPLGVVGIITAGNFPVAVPSWYIVPALLTGNAIVWKPSGDAPLTAYCFAKLIEQAGFPPGSVNVVLGDASTGKALVEATQKGGIHKIGFTGSSGVGKTIGELCGKMLQKPCLELGGKNPMIILPDCNLEAASQAVLFSAFGTAGQRCTSLGTLFLHQQIKSTFLKLLLENLLKIRIGNPMDPQTSYGPMISERHLSTYVRFTEEWIAPHHHLLTPGKGRIRASNPWPHLHDADLENGLYAHPVIVDQVQPRDPLFMEETFGPIIGVCEFETLDQAIDLANASGYGLSSAIFTQNPESAFRFQEEIKSGMVSINNSTTGAEAHLPFGGVGRSGNGSRQSGIWVLDEFTTWQAVNWDYSGILQRAQIDLPDTRFQEQFLLSEILR
jgi:aldehyde dehydrogenase (NAD+)